MSKLNCSIHFVLYSCNRKQINSQIKNKIKDGAPIDMEPIEHTHIQTKRQEREGRAGILDFTNFEFVNLQIR